MSAVALYVESSSVYKTLGADCFDAGRDARTFYGTQPVVAHPPCQQWSRLRAFAHVKPVEKELALHALYVVRRNGGVLEHPSGSQLWAVASLPVPGEAADEWGGWTLPVEQSWWGHPCPKRTWLYIVGCAPRDIPALPFHLGRASGRVASQSSGAARVRTPVAFARWLLALAERCRK